MKTNSLQILDMKTQAPLVLILPTKNCTKIVKAFDMKTRTILVINHVSDKKEYQKFAGFGSESNVFGVLISATKLGTMNLQALDPKTRISLLPNYFASKKC
jgi:hypothetical protein